MKTKRVPSLGTVRNMTTKELLDLLGSDNLKGTPKIYMVRGWILFELEVKNPAEFSAWRNQDHPKDDELRRFLSK